MSAQAAESRPSNPNHKWYIVHAYSNFEKKVADSIRDQAKTQGLEDCFSEILVPTEDVIEIRRGRKINAERKFFPGYVLVKMDLSDVAYHLVKNTPKVTGFLGSQAKPMPVSEREVARIIARRYGEQSEKESDKNKDLGEELADVLFVVLCLANQTGTDLQAAYDRRMEAKGARDKDRHANNPKLKP